MQVTRKHLAPLIAALLSVWTLCWSTPAHALVLIEDEGGGGTGGGTGGGGTTSTTNRIVYLHGRSMNGWPYSSRLAAPAGWTHVTLGYNGSSRLHDSTTRTTINNALKNNCSGANQCVIVCYSAGCARLLRALDDLAASGNSPNHILWITAPASAAGGSEVADKVTKGIVKLLAKLFGGYAPIDEDLRVNSMRSAYGYIQNRAPVPMYHSAGGKNTCKKLLLGLIKICGNKYLPGGYGDGLVPVHSAGGYATTGAHAHLCDGTPKYTNRQADTDISTSTSRCALHSRNHKAMLGVGVRTASRRLGQTSTAVMNDSESDEDMATADETLDDADTLQNNTTQMTQHPDFDGVFNGDASAIGTATCSYGSCTVCTGGSCAAGSYTGGGSCFVAGTPVAMADGSIRPIERVRVGDEVLAYDVAAGRVVASRVTQTFVHPDVEGTVLINGHLRATPNHPVYANGRWVRADELKIGDALVKLPAAPLGAPAMAGDLMPSMGLSVTSLEALPGTQTTFNIEVAEHHDYFADGLLVHNKMPIEEP